MHCIDVCAFLYKGFPCAIFMCFVWCLGEYVDDGTAYSKTGHEGLIANAPHVDFKLQCKMDVLVCFHE